MSKGLRVGFLCERLVASVVPTSVIAEVDGRRWQRMHVRFRRREPMFRWFPVGAKRYVVERMLEAVELDSAPEWPRPLDDAQIAALQAGQSACSVDLCDSSLRSAGVETSSMCRNAGAVLSISAAATPKLSK